MCMLGMMVSERVEDVEPVAEDGLRDRRRTELLERRVEVIPQYVEQLRERVQKDMIPVGKPVLEQVSYK